MGTLKAGRGPRRVENHRNQCPVLPGIRRQEVSWQRKTRTEIGIEARVQTTTCGLCNSRETQMAAACGGHGEEPEV